MEDIEQLSLTELPQSQRDELDRRLQTHRANPQDTVSWDDLKARLQSQTPPPSSPSTLEAADSAI